MSGGKPKKPPQQSAPRTQRFFSVDIVTEKSLCHKGSCFCLTRRHGESKTRSFSPQKDLFVRNHKTHKTHENRLRKSVLPESGGLSSALAVRSGGCRKTCGFPHRRSVRPDAAFYAASDSGNGFVRSAKPTVKGRAHLRVRRNHRSGFRQRPCPFCGKVLYAATFVPLVLLCPNRPTKCVPRKCHAAPSERFFVMESGTSGSLGRGFPFCRSK